MKGHSERVPNKNLRDFCGRPLFHHILTGLLAVRDISEVAIDTDSEEIAASAAIFDRVRIIERPADLRGDMVPMNDIIAHDIGVLEGSRFLQTHSTNPLLTATTIDKAVGVFLEGEPEHDSLFSVTRLQTRLYRGDATPLNHNPAELLRTQDLEPVWEENSNIYIFSRDSFAAAGKARIGLRPQLFEIDALEAIDIDEPRDFALAECLYKIKSEQP